MRCAGTCSRAHEGDPAPSLTTAERPRLVLDPRGEHDHRLTTEYIGLAVEQLRPHGGRGDDTLLAHLSPAQSDNMG